jgi:hypothetical protein
MNQPGVIAAPLTGAARYYPPRAVTFSKIYANLSTPAVGDFTFVLNKNGVNTGYTFTVSNGGYVMTPVVVSIALATTDYLSIDISTGTSSDLRVELEYV